MASIAEQIRRLQLLKTQTNKLREDVSTAKTKLATTATNYTPIIANNDDDTRQDIRAQMMAPIIDKQKQAQIKLNKQHVSDALISSIMATMPKIDYEAEAQRLILRDGKTSLANAIENKSIRTPIKNDTNNEQYKKILLENIDLETSDIELSDTEDSNYKDYESISEYDSTDIEIDESRYPHLSIIRTRPSTPELNSVVDNLKDTDIKQYINNEYDKNIKTIKCWCIMANNAGYYLFDNLEIDTIKHSVAKFQLIPIYNRIDMDNMDWLGIFIQWLYIETNPNTGAKCYFGKGWVLKYYPNHYRDKYPRLVVSTKYKPDFNNERQISAIFKSGYTRSVTLDGKTPIFRQIMATDVAEFICCKLD